MTSLAIMFSSEKSFFPDKRDSSFPARLLTFDLVEHRKHQSLLGRYTKDNFKACSDNRTNFPTVSGVRNNASLKSWHFATPPTVFSRNDVWGKTAEITYWWCVVTLIWVVLLIGWKFTSLLVASQNVGCLVGLDKHHLVRTIRSKIKGKIINTK